MADVRLATPGDVAAVLEFWPRAGADPTPTDDPGSVRRVVERGGLLVADDGGTIVGTLIAVFDGWRGGMYRLAVDPAYRRTGLAAALVAEGERRLVAQGCVRIGAVVVRGTTAAEAFWRSVGYEPDERLVRYGVNRRPPGPAAPA